MFRTTRALRALKAAVPLGSANPLRYLVIDGYTKAGRDDLTNHGASTAGTDRSRHT